MKIEKVGVLGLTPMGRDIARTIAGSGFKVWVWERERDGLLAGRRELETEIPDEEAKAQILSRVSFTPGMAELKDCDLVIEAVPEDLELKKRIFSEISGFLKEDAILATTTACFSVTEIVRSAKNQSNALGMHFLRPARTGKLVEVVRAENVSQEAIDAARIFLLKVGRECVVVKDSPGFIVNYLFVPYMNQALEYFDHGFSDRDGLDTALRMGLGYPKGPLTLIDEIGLDDHLHLSTVLYDRLKDVRFAPPPILKRMVDGGKLGKKSGTGFYKHKP
jgi:3-hydroxybutyryl-CoA dehydrogenase